MNNGRGRILLVLNLVPVLAGLCFPFFVDILFAHVGYIAIYTLVPFACLVGTAQPSKLEETIITRKVSPIGTKGIALYSLPLPLVLFTILLRVELGLNAMVESHVYNVAMILFFCLMVYLLLGVSIRLLEWIENKGGLICFQEVSR